MNELQKLSINWVQRIEEPNKHGLFCYAADALALLEKERAAHRATDANLTSEIERLQEELAQDRAWMRRAYEALRESAGYINVGVAVLTDAPAWLKGGE